MTALQRKNQFLHTLASGNRVSQALVGDLVGSEGYESCSAVPL
jgi:hypothetical protein